MDFDQRQKQIGELILKYEQSPTKPQQMYKKIKNQIKIYDEELINNYASDDRTDWLTQQKRRLDKIQTAKQLGANQVTVQAVKHFGKDIDDRLNQLHRDVQQAIQASTYIRIELDKQIEQLDNLESQNKEFKKRINRAKKGLKVIIARGMMNKCTRFLMVLVILAIIALIIVTILVDNGVINVKQN